ncbi:STM4015 family protein [Symbioplanes lichenis]|uniref:STM4015 family protein n=1 Tax=Symbioplanes lichenis TaxID=1629072 RepID=UPI0027390EED|nr:STM4015 family protein [Actinoplanes lichenis]
MTISSHLETFAGLPIVAWDADSSPADPAAVAWRLEAGSDAPASELEVAFEQVLERAGPGGPVALVLGEWSEAFEMAPPLDLFIRHASRLGRLRSLFIGEMTFEECEISWINQGDYGPLLAAFPELERLWIRGSQGLVLEPQRHERLKELVLQSGGLPPAIVRAVGECDFPQLERLELWLGVENYEGGATLEDLAPILAGRVFPALTYLGLRNAENADEIAGSLAAAPVVGRLRELDLSLGMLGDAGGEALLTGQPLDHLAALTLRHHFMSPEIAERLTQELTGVRVDVSEVQKEEEWGRYTAVAE